MDTKLRTYTEENFYGRPRNGRDHMDTSILNKYCGHRTDAPQVHCPITPLHPAAPHDHSIHKIGELIKWWYGNGQWAVEIANGWHHYV